MRYETTGAVFYHIFISNFEGILVNFGEFCFEIAGGSVLMANEGFPQENRSKED